MSRFTYYTPLWLGAALAALLLRSFLPPIDPGAPWRWWLSLLGGAVAAGLICQLGMLGAQGAFAQVWPVPGGRSIRGRTAVVGGSSVLASIALLVVAWFMNAEDSPGAGFSAQLLAISSGVAILIAGIAYFWGLPAAASDFTGRD